MNVFHFGYRAPIGLATLDFKHLNTEDYSDAYDSDASNSSDFSHAKDRHLHFCMDMYEAVRLRLKSQKSRVQEDILMQIAGSEETFEAVPF